MGQSKLKRNRLNKYIAVMICGLIVLALYTIPHGYSVAQAQTKLISTRVHDSYISAPEFIPFIDFIKTPAIEPGTDGKLKFTFSNHYISEDLYLFYFEVPQDPETKRYLTDLYLVEGQVNNNLMTVFENKKEPLSSFATITKINELLWEIVDGNMIYRIENLTQRFNIYEHLKSRDLTNVELILQIYHYATLKESHDVNEGFDNAPEFTRGTVVEDVSTPGKGEVSTNIISDPVTNIKSGRFYWEVFPINTTDTAELFIKTDSNTPEGTYFIKTELSFQHAGIENRTIVMRSKGHYTDDARQILT
jgi:hypothetical protein